MQISGRLDLTFAALADPTRRAILARLATGEATVTELAEPFAMSQPAISKHLKVLERAGLISMDVDAQRRPRKLEPKRLEEAVEWIHRASGGIPRLVNILGNKSLMLAYGKGDISIRREHVKIAIADTEGLQATASARYQWPAYGIGFGALLLLAAAYFLVSGAL